MKIEIYQQDLRPHGKIDVRYARYFPQILTESGWKFLFDVDGDLIYFVDKANADFYLITRYLSMNINIDVRVVYTDDANYFLENRLR